MTVPMLFANNASSRLYAAIDAVTTSIRVEAGDGGKFPNPAAGEYFTVTVEDRRTSQVEIMNCTGKSGDILNVQRHQEGTAAQAFLVGATVSNRLTAATMDFLAHAGATGPQGPIGPQGPLGPQGPQGPQGVKGDASTVAGPQGPPGTKGDKGDKGDQGIQGAPGFDGAQGSQGPQGPEGPKGNTGDPGIQGNTGDPGPQGVEGPVGPEGPEGPEGPQGQAGTGLNMKGTVPNSGSLPTTGNEQGDAYVAEDTGDVWVYDEESNSFINVGPIQGPPGPPGEDGTQGVDGAPGAPGADGAPGPQGPDGPQGPQGPAGSPDTPAQVLAKLVTVDGIGSGLDADLLDGQQGAWYRDWANLTSKPATFPPTLPIASSGVTGLDTKQASQDTAIGTKLDASAYTAADVLTKIKTVDGTGSGLDADVLDGQDGAYYLARANHTGTQAISTVTGLQAALDSSSGGFEVMPYTFSTNTSPIAMGPGVIRLNGGAGGATLMYVSGSDNKGTATNNQIKYLAKPGMQLYLQDTVSRDKWAIYTVTGAWTEPGSYVQIPVVSVSTLGVIVDATKIFFGVMTDAGSSKVAKAGDTMTGNLTISKADPGIILDKAAAGQGSRIYGRKGGSERWVTEFGNGTAEAGGNAGSDFVINRYSDAAAYLDSPFTILRATGIANFTAIPTINYLPFPAVATIADAAPSSPVNGQLWWQSSTGNLLIYYNDGDSSQWVQVNGAT